MQPRTQRQKQVLEFIVGFIERHGYEPSYSQIARHLGISSKATVAKHVAALEKRGLIERQRSDEGFGLSVNFDEAHSEEICSIPLRGRIAAGEPTDAIIEDEILTLPRFMLGRIRAEKIYALRVKGDSMIEAHICDGDIALIENRADARDGEIVVALVEGERATLKRLYRDGKEVELRPANANLSSIKLPAWKVSIQGVYRGLLRAAC